ncbi:MAG: recombinase family protein [Deltaproteobacteria bacterium]|jgi:site-specific DNA recombinase
MNHRLEDVIRTLRPLEYARKSQEAEERQILSIPSQQKENQRRADSLNLPIATSYVEAHSAFHPGRPVFTEMLDSIERGDANAIVTWKINRLARNSVDAGRVIHLMDQERLVAVITSGAMYFNTGDDKFRMNLEFSMAKKHSDSISEDVRRSTPIFLESGNWPFAAKLGYRRKRDEYGGNSQVTEADEQRFAIIRDGLQLAALGAPLREIKEFGDRRGLLTRRTPKIGGRPVSLSMWHRMCRDPFYAGLMEWRGQRYVGNHPAAITLEQYDAIGRNLSARRNGKKQHDKRSYFPYRGLADCSTCQMPMTAQTLTNRHGKTYRYYFCHRAKRRPEHGKSRAVEENNLDEALVEFIGRLRMSDGLLAAVAEVAREREAEVRGAADDAAQRATIERGKIRTRLATLRMRFLDGMFTETEYQESRAELEEALLRLQQKDFTSDNAPSCSNLLDDAAAVLHEAQNIVLGDDYLRKMLLARALCSNLTIDGEAVLIQAQKPFDALLDDDGRSTLRAFVDEFQTPNSSPGTSILETIQNLAQLRRLLPSSDPAGDRLAS